MNNITNRLLNLFIFILYCLIPRLLDIAISVFNIHLSSYPRVLFIFILLLLDIIPLLFLILMYKKDLKVEFKTFKENFVDNIDKYIKLWLFALILMSISNILITYINGSQTSNNEEAVRNIATILPIYSIITTCIIAPISEELAYRKAIKNIFQNKYLSIIMSGLIFGLAHVIGTYSNISDLLYVLPYGAFGAVFMYIYIESKTIYSTITIHFVHNTLLLIMFFIR